MAWQSFRLSGYAPDLPADAQPPEVWSYIFGCRPVDGIQTASVGDVDNLTVTGTAITRYEWIHAARTLGSESAVYAGADYAGPRARVGLYVTGLGHVDLTPGAWAATHQQYENVWTGGALSTGVLVHDTQHSPLWVDPITGTATVLGAALSFSALRPYKYFAVGVGDQVVAGALNTVRWSASAVPGAVPNVWVPAAGNDAGSFDLTSPGAGYLIDGGRLGEDFVIYGENSTHLMSYVGGPTVMTNRRLSSSTGILARNCWADIGEGHVVMTRDDVVLVSSRGVERSIVDGTIRRNIFDALYNVDGRHMGCKVWHDRRRGHVYIGLPSTAPSGYLTRAWVYEVATGVWGFRELGDQSVRAIATGAMLALGGIGSGGREQPQLVLARPGTSLATSKMVLADANTLGFDQNNAVWRKDDLDLGDASRRKLVRNIRVRGSAGSTVTLKVRVGSKNSADEAYTYGTEQDWVLPTTWIAPIRTSGRFLSVQIRYPSPIISTRVMGFDLDVVAEGER